MKKLISYIIVGLTFSATLCTSCTESGRTPKRPAVLTCDNSYKPIVEDLRELFLHRYSEASIDTIYTDESTAIQKLMDGEVFMTIAARDLRDTEKEFLRTKYGNNARSYKMAYDGFALIQNNQNSDSCITVNDIKRILLGEVSDWKEIYPTSRLGKITIVFDNPSSSTVHFAEDSILKGRPVSKTNAVATNGTKEVIKYVKEHKNAVGIIGSNWLNDTRDTLNITFNKDVRPMYVTRAEVATVGNSYQPFQAYFATGDYPLTRTLWIILNDPYSLGNATKFKNYIVSQNQGQMLILKEGLLPAYGNITFREVEVSRR